MEAALKNHFESLERAENEGKSTINKLHLQLKQLYGIFKVID